MDYKTSHIKRIYSLAKSVITTAGKFDGLPYGHFVHTVRPNLRAHNWVDFDSISLWFKHKSKMEEFTKACASLELVSSDNDTTHGVIMDEYGDKALNVSITVSSAYPIAMVTVDSLYYHTGNYSAQGYDVTPLLIEARAKRTTLTKEGRTILTSYIYAENFRGKHSFNCKSYKRYFLATYSDWTIYDENGDELVIEYKGPDNMYGGFTITKKVEVNNTEEVTEV